MLQCTLLYGPSVPNVSDLPICLSVRSVEGDMLAKTPYRAIFIIIASQKGMHAQNVMWSFTAGTCCRDT